MQHPQAGGGGSLIALHSDGVTKVAPDPAGDCTLLANQLYYFLVDIGAALI